eukprot:4337202-Pyramimonas_sp.AAC.1
MCIRDRLPGVGGLQLAGLAAAREVVPVDGVDAVGHAVEPLQRADGVREAVSELLRRRRVHLVGRAAAD